MRGADRQTAAMFSDLSPEALVPPNHPLRAIRPLVNAALDRLSPDFAKIYSPFGRESIAPEKLLRALLLQAFFAVRSERQLMEQLTYNIMFRWFVGLSMDALVCRRSPDQLRWRCKACRADFTVTSGTLFAWHKLPMRSYLMAIAVFCNEVKGKSMLAFSRDTDVQYKTAFVLAHKLREAVASATTALRIGGHIRPENLAADRIDRRLAENQTGQRQVVVAMRERGGRTLAQVFAAESEALATIRQRIAKGTTVHADESPAWNTLHASFAMRRINHQDG
jgi:hypothetical protein